MKIAAIRYFFAWVFASLAAQVLLGATLPLPVIPNGVAVNIHFTTGHEQDLDSIAAAGFKMIRMDFAWGAMEKERGKYNWAEWDELSANLEKRRLRPIYILDYSNDLYEPQGMSPQDPAAVTAFAHWAAAAAIHFKRQHVIWEIYNEPNGTEFWKPKPDPAAYARLMKAAAAAIRAADPSATIFAPASAHFPWEYLEVVLQGCSIKNLDAFSVHPYRNDPPETVVPDYERLHQLIAKYCPGSKAKIPIVAGEWGYASYNKVGGRVEVTAEVQGDYIVREQLVDLLEGVPITVWYDWNDDCTDAQDKECHFGVLTHDLQPKPAYKAISTMTHELHGYRIVKRLAAGTDQDFLLLCANAAGARKVVAWTVGSAHSVTFSPGKPDSHGRTLTLELNGTPKYVPL